MMIPLILAPPGGEKDQQNLQNGKTLSRLTAFLRTVGIKAGGRETGRPYGASQVGKAGLKLG